MVCCACGSLMTRNINKVYLNFSTFLSNNNILFSSLHMMAHLTGCFFSELNYSFKSTYALHCEQNFSSYGKQNFTQYWCNNNKNL